MKETRTLEIDEAGSFIGIDIKNNDAERVVLMCSGGEEHILSPDDARGLAQWLLKNLGVSTNTLATDTLIVPVTNAVSASSVGTKKKEPQQLELPGLGEDVRILGDTTLVSKTIDHPITVKFTKG